MRHLKKNSKKLKIRKKSIYNLNILRNNYLKKKIPQTYEKLILQQFFFNFALLKKKKHIYWNYLSINKQIKNIDFISFKVFDLSAAAHNGTRSSLLRQK